MTLTPRPEDRSRRCAEAYVPGAVNEKDRETTISENCVFADNSRPNLPKTTLLEIERRLKDMSRVDRKAERAWELGLCCKRSFGNRGSAIIQILQAADKVGKLFDITD